LQVWDNSSLATLLVKHALVDEQAVMIEPVLLGGASDCSPTTPCGRRTS